MKDLFFVRSSLTCRILRIFAVAMLLLPVNLQPARASRQDAGSRSLLSVKMKDATLRSVFAEVERTSRYAFIYTDDVQPLLGRKVSVSLRSVTIDELLSVVLTGNRTERTGAREPGNHLENRCPEKRGRRPSPGEETGR